MDRKSIFRLPQGLIDRGGSDQVVLLGYLNSLAVNQDDEVQKKLLGELIQEYVLLEKRVDGLLKNTLPEMVANEIKYEGRFAPRSCQCSILFSDIVGFTRLAESISAEVLIELLDGLFRGVDDLILRFGGTKIKTIGDAYMAVFGAPLACEDHAVLAVRAGLELLKLVDAFDGEKERGIRVRVGIHSGRVMAGVVGKERMQFDVFGDCVNIASRFESSGEPGRINVSRETYLRTREFFEFEERGEIVLKNKANMKAYFVVKER